MLYIANQMNPKDAFISDFRIEKGKTKNLYNINYLIQAFGKDQFKIIKPINKLKEITDRENNEYFFGIDSINI